METKELDSLGVAGITTGVLLVEGGFSHIHEAMEWVMGHPVWTHELPGVWDEAKARVLKQIPDMPTEANPDTFGQVASEVRNRFGLKVVLQKGDSERTQGPVETLMAKMK